MSNIWLFLNFFKFPPTAQLNLFLHSFILRKDENQFYNKEFIVKKLATENKELYGSVKPTEISKIIKEKEKLDIKPSMIQPTKEIKSLGNFRVKVSLHSEIDAEIHIVVESAETIQ